MLALLQPEVVDSVLAVAEEATSPTLVRVLYILLVAAVLHLLVRLLRQAGEWVVTPDSSPAVARELFSRRKPKIATVTTLFVSAITFAIYFIAVGVVVRELELFDIRTYFASATVIGLAVAFGSQGLVQDIVIGMTLIFSNVFNVGDVVEISGQVGRVEKVGLRFTTLTNFLGQSVFIPNRNIALIGRFRRGAIRAFIDVQVPTTVPEDEVVGAIHRVARGMRAQQPAILLTDPEIMGPFDAAPGDWRFARLKLRLWPGQGPFIEGPLRQRLLATMRRLDPDYADWMLTISYRVS
jgi:moderate conductance mechanosensitive channel